MQPDIYEHIAEYITASVTGEVSDAAKKHVEFWLKQSPENQKEFDRLKKSWELSGEINTTKPDVDAAWLKVKDKVNTVTIHQKNTENVGGLKVHKTTVKKMNNWVFARAASIIILISLSITFWFYVQSNAWLKLINDKIATQSGETRNVTLTDGTVVTLNANSTLYFPNKFDKEKRAVLLEGEAYFEVAHNLEKPFIITSGEVETTVLGTKFNLRYFKDELVTELLLNEGKVAFEANGKKEIVLPGEVIQFNAEKSELKKEQNSNPNILAWKTKELKFNETPFNDVIKTLQRYYNVKFELKDTGNLECRYTGSFNKNTLNEVLEIMQLSTTFTFKNQDNKILITGSICPE